MSEHREPDLREWLRSGDPATDHPGLPEADRAVMRARIVEAARSPDPADGRNWARLLPAVAAIFLLFVIGALLPSPERFAAPGPEAAYRVADDGTPLFFGEPTASRGLEPRTDLRPRWSLGPAEDARASGRHIEFTTPGGHRVVWTLDTDFRLPDDSGSDNSPATRS